MSNEKRIRVASENFDLEVGLDGSGRIAALHQLSRDKHGLPDQLWNQVREQRKTATEMVTEFHEAFGLPVGESFKPLNERLELRLKLIKEEVQEMLDAVEEGDWVNVLKELSDIEYVVEGMALEIGVPLHEVTQEVHRSNMSKLDADGKPIYRADGKVLKGPNYSEADVQSIVSRHDKSL